MSGINKSRTCPYSKTDFVPKRNNQIFSSSKCRIAYHNEINNALRRKLNSINKQLMKNFKILNALLGSKNEISVNPYFLRGAGFSFKTFTHVGRRGEEFVYGIYDISYYQLNQDEYIIYRTK
jgi:hypothetical protein